MSRRTRSTARGIFGLLACILAFAQALLAFGITFFSEGPAVVFESVGIVFGIIGYVLGYRRLAVVAIFLCVAAMIIGLIYRQGIL